jgi:hypothetical protein
MLWGIFGVIVVILAVVAIYRDDNPQNDGSE